MKTSKHWKKVGDTHKLRKSLGQNQMEFWNRLGVTQSGGSRYESGRDMPPPAQKLFHLAYLPKILPALAELRGVSVGQLMVALQDELSDLAKTGKL